MSEKVLTRSEQKEEDTWKLEDMYENEELYTKEYTKLQELLKEIESKAGTLTSADALLSVLDLYESISYYFSRLYVYANQRNHEDTNVAKYQKMSGEMSIMASRLGASTSFLQPEVLEISEETLNSYFKENTKLNKYKRFIERITAAREHTLDKEKEAMLARAEELGQSPDLIFSMFDNADVVFNDIEDQDGNKHPLTLGTYISYMESKDRVLRRNAFKELYREYKQYNNTLAAIYYANLKQADFFAKERKYANCQEEQLTNNEIPMEVYTNLIDAIHEHLPAMYDYVALRKKIMGYDELHMYDVYVSLANLPETKYTYEKAKEIVLEGLAVLGEDYLDLLREGFNNRWIDVYENKGKRTGAYSWGAYGTHPYVLLNYHETLDNVFTLAHEMGHSIHTYYSNKTQTLLNSEYSIFVAEVASTCNESLLIHYLMEHSKDQEEKKYLMNYFLDQFKGTMYRQTMFGEFEMLTHNKVANGEMLTAKEINDIYLELNKKYFGEDMISDEEIQYEWSRIPHFYTPFYVYQYATSFAAAIAISTKILNKEEGIVEKYKQFLSGGCSMTPIDLLKICGVDMSKKDSINSALDVFEEYVETFKKLCEE